MFFIPSSYNFDRESTMAPVGKASEVKSERNSIKNVDSEVQKS
jgi:hypothetical protein